MSAVDDNDNEQEQEEHDNDNEEADDDNDMDHEDESTLPASTVSFGNSSTRTANTSAANMTIGAENKWSKNGFGEPCTNQGGKFTREETETVRRAVEEYCAVKQISTARLCSECDHKAELKGAWMEIAKRLPHRTVQSVYRHGLRQLHPFKRGPWSEAECQTLLELVTRMGKKWSAIQAKLHRSADSCRDKYREMSVEFIKGRWKEGETEILKRLIREHLRADPNADIKDLGQLVEDQGIVIPWSTISKRMGKRSRLSCFKKWQKMTGLYSPSDQSKVPGDNPDEPTTPSSAPARVKAPAAASATTTKARVTLPAAPVVTLLTVKDEQQDHDTPMLEVPPEATRNAPTAGAAAAAAAAALAAVTQGGNYSNAAAMVATTTVNTTADDDLDLYLLSVVAQNKESAKGGGGMDWSLVSREIADPQARWNALVDEWQDEEGDEAEALLEKLHMSDIAQLLLERKQQQQGDAKMAAETVEAVDLPPIPGSIREV